MPTKHGDEAMEGRPPPKFAVGDLVRANEKAPGDYKGRRGQITDIGPGKAEYGVRFAPEPKKAGTGYLMSWWLDAV